MNTTITTTVNAATTANASMPSIAVPAGATVSFGSGDTQWAAPVINNAYSSIATLVADQEIWLNGVHRTANEQLYVLLQRCYHLYSLMVSDKETNEQLKAAIERHNKERNLGIDDKSHTMTQIIKVVFGADRRRASSYSTALRVAFTEKVKVEDLPKFLRDAGGVEEVRRQQTNGGAPKLDKVAAATKHISNVTLAVIDEDAISSKLDCGAIGKQVVLLATQDVNGKLNINAVVQTENVAKAVLTAIYNAEHKKWAKPSGEEQSMSEEDELDALIEAAANEGELADAA
jgi:hypothetical protein